MSGEAELRERLRKIEALFAGAGTVGEKLAAEAALERVRARLAELQGRDELIEMQVSLGDQWSRQLFLALCRRYGLKPYRLPSPATHDRDAEDADGLRRPGSLA